MTSLKKKICDRKAKHSGGGKNGKEKWIKDGKKPWRKVIVEKEESSYRLSDIHFQ